MKSDRRPCYCLSLFRNHVQGARGCGFNADGSQRILCGGCGKDMERFPKHTHRVKEVI